MCLHCVMASVSPANGLVWCQAEAMPRPPDLDCPQNKAMGAGQQLSCQDDQLSGLLPSRQQGEHLSVKWPSTLKVKSMWHSETCSRSARFRVQLSQHVPASLPRAYGQVGGINSLAHYHHIVSVESGGDPLIKDSRPRFKCTASPAPASRYSSAPESSPPMFRNGCVKA